MSFRWGLIPWWSKDAKSGSRLFNARGETVATKASFREAFRERRIIVPADGFYEWHKTKTGAPAAALLQPGRRRSRWPSPAWPSAGATRTRRRARPTSAAAP